MIGIFIIGGALLFAAGCASYNSQGDIERDPIPEANLTLEEADLAAIAHAMARDIGEARPEDNACSPLLTGANEEFNVFDYAARQLLARYENTRNSSPVLTALQQRPSPEARQAIVSAISLELANNALGNPSLLALYSQIRQQAYDNYCHKLINSGFGLPRFPRIDLKINETILLGLIERVPLPATNTTPAPADIQAYLRSLNFQTLQDFCPSSQAQPQFAICRLSHPIVPAGIRNQQLVLYGEGINLPTNESGFISNEGYQIRFIRLETRTTYNANLNSFVDESTVSDFAGHYNVGLQVNLPSNLEAGAYRIEVRLQGELIGLEDGFEVRPRGTTTSSELEVEPEENPTESEEEQAEVEIYK